MSSPELPKMDMRLTRKVKENPNDPRNFNMVEVSVGVQNITAETTEEDVMALLSGPGAIAYKCMRQTLNEKLKEMLPA